MIKSSNNKFVSWNMETSIYFIMFWNNEITF